MAALWKKLNNLHAIDRAACGDTALHRRQPLAHLLVTLAYIVSVISVGQYSPAGLIPFLAYPVFLLILGELSPAVVLRRLLPVLPFILLIGIFNPIFNRTPLPFGGITIAAGWISFLTLLLKCVLTTLSALLFVSFSGISGICGALRALHVPKIICAQLSFTYRYIFLLGDEAVSISTAHALRSGGAGAFGVRHWGSMAGQWMIRSLHRAQRIYSAMTLRGFAGELPAPPKGKFKTADVLYIVFWLAYFALTRFSNIAEVIGAKLIS